MTPLVIGISGGIAAGKTAFIQALSAKTGAATTGFGDYVREQASSRSLHVESRDVLQQLGEQLKRDLGDEEFVCRVLARADHSAHVIVDGVRHVEIADVIQRVVAPRRFALLFLDVDDETRRERAESRATDDAARFDQLAAHSTERQVHDGRLRARADLVIDATAPIPTIVADAVAFLRL
ncbi:AAA family ATPase [Polyangium jinanense]|uniref:AAA family ATPase n=1 Tax=Polyangium jinanense TaxID=2829994 RepID=A0A9X3X910_9BACT|nr:AAA family ATPase [Polyangium jinanense]MDC3985964.1 AAA family ATPase [Polyangium jinanense]